MISMIGPCCAKLLQNAEISNFGVCIILNDRAAGAVNDRMSE
jgi:hypothetical protein